MSECIWFATTKWFLSEWLVIWKIPDANPVCYAAIIPKPAYDPFSLSASQGQIYQ